MQTFSQYAATRLLREHPARTLTFGGVAVKAGSVQTFTGVDLITGMPVLIYTLPERPAAIPSVYSEFIPTILETGFEHELGYVVAASAPGYAPLKPTLSQPRLEWLARTSARALADAHAGGLHHGNLEPVHFLVSGDSLMLEGWGLPWGEALADYRAPEGGASAAADVFAWARSLQALGRGNPRLMLEGEMGRWIAHGLNAKPQDRPTAQEMVMALEKLLTQGVTAIPRESVPPPISYGLVKPLEESVPAETPGTASNTVPPEIPVELPPEPSRLSATEENLKALEAELVSILPAAQPTPDSEPRPSGAELPVFEAEPAELHELEHLAADEPDVQIRAMRESEFDLDAPEPGLIVKRDSNNPIRIGFEQDDESWRQVVQPDAGAASRRLWVPIALVVLALACLAGLFLLLMRPPANQPAEVTTLNVPGDPVAGSVVNFKLKPDSARQGRLVVLQAPETAKLEANSVLATVPGPVLFKTPGVYRLRVVVDGYNPGEFQLAVPGQTEIVLELKQP